MSRSDTPPNAPEEPMPRALEADANFEIEAEKAETEAALERDLEGTFPTSDPSSSWAGPDVEPEPPNGDQPSEASSTSPSPEGLAASPETPRQGVNSPRDGGPFPHEHDPPAP